MNLPKLISADVLDGYIVHLSYSDGADGDVNLEPELTGGIFTALRDPSVFRGFSVNTLFGSLEWDNGANFSPEFLYEATRVSSQQKAGLDIRVGSRKSA